jgi:hypothetical protein
LADRADLGAVAQLIVDALRSVFDYPDAVASAIAPYAAAHGLRQGDGIRLLRWLLDLSGDPEADRWIAEAAAAEGKGSGSAGGVP